MRTGTTLVTLAAVAALGLSHADLGGGPSISPPEASAGRTPVVFVSGVTGTKLRDPRTSELVWGASRQLLRPHDGGYRLVLPLSVGMPDSARLGPVHPQAHYEVAGPIWQLRLPGWVKMIYQPLLERFEQEGYRLGELTESEPTDDLFFFNYDWRYGNLESVRRLDSQLEALSQARAGSEVDLVCQSNAAKICRWLAKYGALDADAAESGAAGQRRYRIRKLILLGASNSGALRVLQLLTQGRRYIPLVGRRLHPETFFSIRPLFEDLPHGRDDLFFDDRGKTLSVDLFDASNWVKYGWSIFGRAANERLDREPRSDLFGDRQDQLDYLGRQLRRSRRLQILLARDSDHFPAVQYYRLENASAPTIDRALLTRERGEWQTYFLGDPPVDGHPVLRKLAAALGDGHAVLSSQRGLSPQEAAALAGTATMAGGHFEAVVQPRTLDALLAFLAEPPRSARPPAESASR